MEEARVPPVVLASVPHRESINDENETVKRTKNSYSARALEVTVDEETGIVRVEKIWIAHDVGKPVYPVLAIGQIEGSVYMGLGEVLYEEPVFRRNLHKIPSLLDYKSSTFLEMPPVESFLVETLDPEGPFGAKECGQGQAMSMACWERRRFPGGINPS